MNDFIREITPEEIDQVEGGFLPAVVLLAVVVAGCATNSDNRSRECMENGGSPSDC